MILYHSIVVPCTYHVHTSISSTYSVTHKYVPGTYQYIPVYNMFILSSALQDFVEQCLRQADTKTGPDQVKVDLDFFSTFEELQLPRGGGS